MKRILNRVAATALLVGLGVLGTFARAEDEATRDEQPRRQRNKIVERVSAKYWIGVQAIPIDDALKSQLKLEDRLIVRSVMPNSPAATGGIQQHDILLRIGERDVRNLEDLFKAVSGQREKT
ncbi:MAG TPA: PDZ domain-containing protein, partial [Pirellulaceae bacterium]|nr:PDZ domain-containing protein [Pirellulaceae bacterium]